MKRMLPILPVLLLAFLALPAARQLQAARPASSVAYVSLQRVLAETTEEKADEARLQALQQQKAADLKARQRALESTRDQLAQAGGLFKASARARLQREEQQQKAELEKATALAQAELQALQRQLQNNLRTRLTSVLNELAKRDGIQLVVNQDTSVLWSAPGTDLTSEVIHRLNAAAAAAKPNP